MINTQFPEGSPEWFVERAKIHVENATRALKQGLDQIDDDLQAKALMETASEVLGGLTRAFTHYTHRTEAAWRKEE